MDLLDRLQRELGSRPRRLSRLAGGCVGDVLRAEFADRPELVVKVDSRGTTGLAVEGRMLRELAARAPFLPIPKVELATANLLVMESLPGSTGCSGPAEEHLADLLALLHAIPADGFGLDYPTRIGGLEQPNDPLDSWLEFFAERRLRHFARLACERGRLGLADLRSIERTADGLHRHLCEPAAPALLHGDLWSGNVLSQKGQVTGLIDPAIHHGHPEVELAFLTLFGSVGERFFARYRERTGGPDQDFFRTRREVYNLYPLLVHTVLFGGGYADDVRKVVSRFA